MWFCWAASPVCCWGASGIVAAAGGDGPGDGFRDHFQRALILIVVNASSYGDRKVNVVDVSGEVSSVDALVPLPA